MQDLATLIAGVKNVPTLTLPKGSYSLNRQLKVSTPNLTIDGGGSVLVCPAGSNSNFDVWADGFTLANFIIPKYGVLIRARGADCKLSNCTLGYDPATGKPMPDGSGFQAFITMGKWQSKGASGGLRPVVENCKIGRTKTVSVYFEQSGGVLTGSTLDVAVDEYAFRAEIGGDDGETIPEGLTIDGCTLSNGWRKDTAGFREYHGIAISNTTFNGNVRYGQVPKDGHQTKLGEFDGNCTIDGCIFNDIFTGAPAASVRNLITCYQGVDLRVSNCTFNKPTAACISAAVASKVQMGGNSVVLGSNRAIKLFAVSSKGTGVDLGGNSYR